MWRNSIKGTHRVLGKTDAIEVGKKFINFPFLRFVAVDDEIIRRSQVIREKYHLKPRDSIHLSCALERNISEIITDDTDFDGIKEIRRVPLTYSHPKGLEVLTFALLSSSFLTVRTVSPELITKS